MCDWICYLIMSLDSRDTYIGSTNNFAKRLNNHNNNDPCIKRKGAKRTRGKTWIPIIIISDFHHKNACLSFEAGWKRLAQKRSNKRLLLINDMTCLRLYYTRDTRWNRLMDLIYFIHNFTLIDTKFIINSDIRHPLSYPDQLTIGIFMETWISDFPWPYFIDTYNINA